MELKGVRNAVKNIEEICLQMFLLIAHKAL